MFEYRIKSVDRVVDGDTVDITVDLGFSIFHKVRVRLEGIDTPEVRTKDLREKAAGIAAADFLEQILEGVGQLTIKTSKQGKYGRYLGTIYKDGKNLNEVMIVEGYAERYEP